MLLQSIIYSDKLFIRCDCNCIFELFKDDSPKQLPDYDHLSQDDLFLFDTRPACVSGAPGKTTYYPGVCGVGHTSDFTEWADIVGEDIFSIALFNLEIVINPDSIIHECPNA